jgi:hypothetical protein
LTKSSSASVTIGATEPVRPTSLITRAMSAIPVPQRDRHIAQLVDQLVKRTTRRNDIAPVDITSSGGGEFGCSADIQGLGLQLCWQTSCKRFSLE